MAAQPSGQRLPVSQFCGRTRRQFLWELGGGFTGVALTALLDGDGFFAGRALAVPPASPGSLNPLAPRPPNFCVT